jgi:SAM-dependent methyltransferase
VEIIVISSVSDSSGIRGTLSCYEDRIVFCETGNMSFGPMMDRALEIATGEFIVCMEEGDVSWGKTLELQVQLFRQNPDIGFIATAYQVIDEDGNVRGTMRFPEAVQNNILFVLLYGHTFGRSTVIVRRECYDMVGGHEDRPASRNDMWVRLARKCKLSFINMPLVKQGSYPVNENLQRSIFKDAQQVVSEAMASIPLEEIFPNLLSTSEDTLTRTYALAAKAAVLVILGMHKDAQHILSEIHQLCPDASIHRMWMGILSRQTGDYEAAVRHFLEVPQSDGLYLEAQWGAILSARLQKEAEDARGRFYADLSNQCRTLLQLSLDIASGKLTHPPPLVSDIAEEVRLYLGWDAPRLIEALSKGTEMTADEWERRSPQTPDEVTNFYKETENYIFDLAWWHRSPQRKGLTMKTMEICRKNGAREVLDFGCGIGQDGILLAEDGFAVTLADLPGRTFEFVRWRVERIGLPIDLTSTDELRGEYDVILCFDVLEHLWEPEETVEYLYSHLSGNGILLVTANFDHDEVHPMHLERNVKYSGMALVDMISRVGFRVEGSFRTPMIFRKVGRETQCG